MQRQIAVVGAGNWGRNLVQNFARLNALHTVCDCDESALTRLRSIDGVIFDTDFRRVLGNDEVKGVVLATPARLHHRMAKEVLRAGKDVFVEKPLALTVAEGTEIVDMAESAGRVLLVGHVLEYHPALHRLRDMVRAGELGKIRYIYSNRLNLGRLRTEENVLWSFAPHDIAAILGLLGNAMPVEVASHGGSYLHSHNADMTLTSLTFRGDVRAHIFVSWLHPFKEQRLVVVGERMMAEFVDTDPTDKLKVYEHQVHWSAHVPYPVKGAAQPILFATDEPLRLECQDFLRCMESREIPVSNGARALEVLKVLEACQESLEAGGAGVRLDRTSGGYFAHQTAIVEQPVDIGAGTRIWHFTHIMPGVHIGRECVFGQNVFVAKNVRIGDNVKVENNVSVFEGVTLEDDVFCGPSCVFTNVTNPRSHVPRTHEYRPTLIRKGASLGANSVIVCGHTVGRFAFVGAGAIVTHDVPDHALVVGNPARRIGWVCACGVRLAISGCRLTCPECGAAYVQQTAEAIKPAKEVAHANSTH